MAWVVISGSELCSETFWVQDSVLKFNVLELGDWNSGFGVQCRVLKMYFAAQPL